jgi:putative ABC transport system substrate-binding protein
VVGCSPRRQGTPMRRREFITLLGGAAAWVSPARAQEPRRVIGVLSGFGLAGFFADVTMPAFVQGLKDAGFVEGRNISIEIRSADGHYDRLPSLAAELVGRNVAAIYASDLPSAFAAKAATQTIPLSSQRVPMRSRWASSATGRSKLQVQQCPQCPDSERKVRTLAPVAKGRGPRSCERLIGRTSRARGLALRLSLLPAAQRQQLKRLRLRDSGSFVAASAATGGGIMATTPYQKGPDEAALCSTPSSASRTIVGGSVDCSRSCSLRGRPRKHG